MLNGISVLNVNNILVIYSCWFLVNNYGQVELKWTVFYRVQKNGVTL
jgi:hypothetical protein